MKGNLGPAIQHFKEDMKEEASQLNFEKAAILKKKIEHLEDYSARSVIVNSRFLHADVFSLLRDGDSAYVNYLLVQNGTIVQTHTIPLQPQLDETDEEILAFAIVNLRATFSSTANELIVPFPIEFPVEGIQITVPKGGDKKQLLDLSEKNVNYFFDEMRRKKTLRLEGKDDAEKKKVLYQLQEDLQLPIVPLHIECFDNSHFQGSYPVSAMVCFRDGMPSKKDYRHFNIKGVGGIDDFKMLSEVLSRRMKHSGPLPDLLIVDGGKGQLSAAVKVLKDLGFDHVRLAGMAKARTLSEKNYFKSRGPQRSFVAHEIHRSEERIFLPNRSNAVLFPRGSGARFLLERIRDEAHRFAITHHRKRRKKATLKSALDAVVGLGPKTRNHLLRVFGSVAVIQQTSVDELVEKGGIDRALAERIKR